MKLARHKKTTVVWFHFCEGLRGGKSRETGSRTEAAGVGSLCSMGAEFQSGKTRKVLEMGDGVIEQQRECT